MVFPTHRGESSHPFVVSWCPPEAGGTWTRTCWTCRAPCGGHGGGPMALVHGQRLLTSGWIEAEKPASPGALDFLGHFTMVYGRYNYSIHGVYKPTYNWGAPSCRRFQRNLIGFGQWWVCLKMLCTPIIPMVLLIIIPFLNGYNWRYTPFSDKPIYRGL